MPDPPVLTLAPARYTAVKDNDDGTFPVGSVSTPGNSYLVRVHRTGEKSVSCSCGRRHVLDAYFCGHELAVLSVLGLAAEDYISPLFTTEHWRRQYEGSYELPAATFQVRHPLTLCRAVVGVKG